MRPTKVFLHKKVLETIWLIVPRGQAEISSSAQSTKQRAIILLTQGYYHWGTRLNTMYHSGFVFTAYLCNIILLLSCLMVYYIVSVLFLMFFWCPCMAINAKRWASPRHYTVDPMLFPSGNPFKCHEEALNLYLQPSNPPKRYDIFSSLTRGCSEGGLGAF